jgi:hypothetical protein
VSTCGNGVSEKVLGGVPVLGCRNLIYCDKSLKIKSFWDGLVYFGRGLYMEKMTFL